MTAKRKRKKGKVQIVTRPIICICNDLYANTLRPLRDVARIFHFKKPDARKIGTRLRRICQIEKIEVESNALNVLCQRSDGDVRTCLNSLEFLQKSQKKLSMASLVGMGIGGKDKTNNVFNVMESVFNSDNKEHLGGRSGAAATAPRSPGSGPSRRQQLVTHLFEKIMNFGETDLLLSSCFENLLKVKFRDIDLSKTTQASEWFVFADELSSRIADSQEYSLNTYRAAVPIALRFLASAPAKPQLSYPKMESQANAKQRIHQSTLHTWMSNLMPLAKTGMNSTTAVMDVIPALCASLVPKGLRPVAPELMRSNERVTLKRVVDHMVSYGLGLKINNDMMMSNGSFHGSFMPQTTYCLQPEIDKFHRYSSSKSGHGISMKGEVKQIISYELESRKIRSTRDLGVKQTLHDKVKKKSKEKEALLVQKSNNWLTRMGAHVEKAQEQKRLGWAAGQGGTICRKRVFPMLYTYHEGVTNAVKRRLTLQEII
jgi:chromosome transmission fidelity protein 18